MKKLVAALVAVLLLWGCGAENPEPVEEPSQRETAPSEQKTEKKPAGPVTVTFAEDNMDAVDELTGQVPILNFRFQWVNVSIPGREEAAEKINSTLEQETRRFMNGTGEEEKPPYGAGLCVQYAQEGYEQRPEDFIAYAVERSYVPLRGDHRVLTLAAEDYCYLGGAHGSFQVDYLNFDTETGELLHLEDLTEDPDGFRVTLTNMMVEMANTREDIGGRIDWFQKDQYEEVLGNLLRDGSWRFDGQDFVIVSDEYELGSYAAGPIAFRIPLEDLKDFINPRYLPETSGEGRLTVSDRASGVEIGNLTGSGQVRTMYLNAEGRVYDVWIRDTGGDLGYGQIPGKAVWYCGIMEDSSLKIAVEIPEFYVPLMIYYRTTDGRSHKAAISVSGEDGHLFLDEIVGES